METTRNSIPRKALHVLLAAALAVGLLVPSLALAPAKAHAAQGVNLTIGPKIEYDAYEVLSIILRTLTERPMRFGMITRQAAIRPDTFSIPIRCRPRTSVGR